MRGTFIFLCLVVLFVAWFTGCDKTPTASYELHWVGNRVITYDGDTEVYTVYLDSSTGYVAFETNSRGAHMVSGRHNLWVSQTWNSDEENYEYNIHNKGNVDFKFVDKDYEHNTLGED